MSKTGESQDVKEQVKSKRGCRENSAAKSCKMCKACMQKRAKSNMKIEKK